MKDVAVVAYWRTGVAKAVRGALNRTYGIPLAVIGACTAGGMATSVYLEW